MRVENIPSVTKTKEFNDIHAPLICVVQWLNSRWGLKRPSLESLICHGRLVGDFGPDTFYQEILSQRAVAVKINWSLEKQYKSA